MKTLSRSRLAGVLCLGLAFLLSHPVFAGFSVHNTTAQKLMVAVGYYQHNGWYASGWYAVAPGQTSELIPGQLDQRYYYVYAYDLNNRQWTGSYPFCTTSRRFYDLPQHPGCYAVGHEQKGFFQVDTKNQAVHVQTLADNAAPGATGCRVVADFADACAQLLERFIDLSLPNLIHRFDGVDIGNNATLQFQVNRNGPVAVRAGASGEHFGTLEIDVPVKVVDIRVDWNEQGRSTSVRRQTPVESATVVLHSTIQFTMAQDRMKTVLTNDFTWDYKPAFTMFGRNISPGAVAEPYVNIVLKGINRRWFGAVNPLQQTFVNNNCDWKPVSENALSYLNHCEPDEVDAARLEEMFQEFLERELNYSR
jgi:uncharacterized membrane protein